MSWTQTQKAERGIVLQVLRDDHDEAWTLAELEAELDDFDAQVVRVALERLEGDNVVVVDDEQVVRASACTRHLDALGLVSI